MLRQQSARLSRKPIPTTEFAARNRASVPAPAILEERIRIILDREKDSGQFDPALIRVFVRVIREEHGLAGEYGGSDPA